MSQMGKCPLYSMDRRLGKPQGWSEHGGNEEKNPVRNQTLVIQPVAYHYTDLANLSPYYTI
jgi:hypothetical protein